MDRHDIAEIAYSMQEAYQIEKTQGEAIEKVKNKHPAADLNILWAMWAAIDAYVDINQ
jgi:hypothetical protein